MAKWEAWARRRRPPYSCICGTSRRLCRCSCKLSNRSHSRPFGAVLSFAFSGATKHFSRRRSFCFALKETACVHERHVRVVGLTKNTCLLLRFVQHFATGISTGASGLISKGSTPPLSRVSTVQKGMSSMYVYLAYE